MATKSRPRYGSLQFWPRKRARKFLPRVNWLAIKSKTPGILGFISYKVSMASCSVSDNSSNSMTKNKKIIIPSTILECPDMKIFSVRFYKYNKPIKEIIISNDKKLKKLLKVPKQLGKIEDIKEEYDDIRVLIYSKVGETGIKKTPDMTEIGLSGSVEEKLEFVKSHISKDITLDDFLGCIGEEKLVDVRGLTKGQGFSGPVKRFGIELKGHKSEKGVRRPGSLGPWHPARVTFRVPMAGQLGMFSRIGYNKKIIHQGKIAEVNINKKSGWKHFGNVKTNFIIVLGSVQGPAKRQTLVTKPLRPTKKKIKLNYEFLGIEK